MDAHQFHVIPAISQAPGLQDSFQDDFMGTAKAFQKFNSFRKLHGFKQLQWNNILGELAVTRSREFMRSKRMKKPFTLFGSKFNVGVQLFDMVIYM